MGLQIVRKISTAVVCGRVEKPEKTIDLYNVGGIVRKLDYKETDLGTSARFSGEFRAITLRKFGNVEAGEIFEAPVLYLPNVAGDIVEQAMLAAAAKSEHPEVEFAVTITLMPDNDPKNGRGYKYGAKPLHQPVLSDALAAISQKMGIKALPEPTPAAPAKFRHLKLQLPDHHTDKAK